MWKSEGKEKNKSLSRQESEETKSKLLSLCQTGSLQKWFFIFFFIKKQQNYDSKESFVVIIYEVNSLKGANYWWIDSGATRDICKDNSLFKRYELEEDGCVIYMINSSTATVKGKAIIDLELTSEKLLTLKHVNYIPEVRKNLVYDSFLNKYRFELVFKLDKFVLTKEENFVGKE